MMVPFDDVLRSVVEAVVQLSILTCGGTTSAFLTGSSL